MDITTWEDKAKMVSSGFKCRVFYAGTKDSVFNGVARYLVGGGGAEVKW